MTRVFTLAPIVFALATAGHAADLSKAERRVQENIAEAGLEKVWALKETAGNTGPQRLRPATDCKRLPGGCQAIEGPLIYLPNSGAFDLRDWDFTGYTVQVRGTSNVRCTNCKFAGGGPKQHQLLTVGVDSGTGTATLTCERCAFDYSKITTLMESGVTVWGIARFTNSRFENAPQDLITQAQRASSLTVTDSYFRRWGQASAPAAHLEAIHAFAGRFTFAGNFLDGRDGKGPGVTSGCTSLLFPNAERGGGGGSITWTVSGNILLGAKAHQCPAIIQFGAGGGANKGTLVGNLMDKPSSVYVSVQNGATISGEGNLDIDSGKKVKLP